MKIPLDTGKAFKIHQRQGKQKFSIQNLQKSVLLKNYLANTAEKGNIDTHTLRRSRKKIYLQKFSKSQYTMTHVTSKPKSMKKNN